MTKKFAMLFANWIKFGEKWNTPLSIVNELRLRGNIVDIYNLYHDDGFLDPRKGARNYSNQGLNLLFNQVRGGENFDVVMVMDYGPFQSNLLSKQFFPNSILVKECGDEPQAWNYHAQTAKQFDLVLTPDYRCHEWYKQNNINSKFWTHWADENIFMEYSDITPWCDCISTCGPRGDVTTVIQKELGTQFNNERYFYGIDHAKRLNMGKMVFQKSQHGEITRRIFEGMACKRMVITDRLAQSTKLAEIFTENDDIIFYDNAQDAIDKIRFYASHDDERNKIALNGFNKVISDHTVKARVDKLLEYIEEIS